MFDFRPFMMAGIAVTGLLAACSSLSSATDAPALDGTAWALSALPGQALVPGSSITLSFDAGRASGTDGCNRYSTGYAVTRGSLQVDPQGTTTMMACLPPVMSQATTYMSRLAQARTYRVSAGQLELLAADGTLLARLDAQAQSLGDTAWRVTGYNNGRQAVVSVLGSTTLTMVFGTEGQVSGTAGCNNYTASYTSTATAVRIGPAAATRRMCGDPEQIMAQEQQFLKALETVAAFRREGEQLELRTGDGALAVSLARDGP
jgi:heat shock protein HslJ